MKKELSNLLNEYLEANAKFNEDYAEEHPDELFYSTPSLERFALYLETGDVIREEDLPKTVLAEEDTES